MGVSEANVTANKTGCESSQANLTRRRGGTENVREVLKNKASRVARRPVKASRKVREVAEDVRKVREEMEGGNGATIGSEITLRRATGVNPWA